MPSRLWSPATSRPSARSMVTFCCRSCSMRIAAEGDGTSFTIDDVADEIVAKLIRRHPYVFGT